MLQHLSILDGVRKKWISGSVPHNWGARCSLTFPHFPYGRNNNQNLSWHSAVPPRRRGDAGKVKLFLLLSLMHPISNFLFFHWCTGTSPLDSGTSTKALSFISDCQIQYSLKEDGKKHLFYHFDIMSLHSVNST